MAVINKTFTTKQSAVEMKNYISTKLLPNPALSSLLDSAFWDGDTLHINSKLGSGNIKLYDYRVDVYIDLNIFGSAAKKVIESTLDSEMKLLNK